MSTDGILYKNLEIRRYTLKHNDILHPYCKDGWGHKFFMRVVLYGKLINLAPTVLRFVRRCWGSYDGIFFKR
jgi:hypothetical protein